VHLPRIFFPKEKKENDLLGPEDILAIERQVFEEMEQEKKSKENLECSTG